MENGKEYLLLIDSATEVCSVALGKTDGTVIDRREEHTPNKHSELLALFADELLREIPGGARAGLSGVIISEGPGSYTGLRIGASFAKGLCWTLGIPLVVVPTTEALALGFLQSEEGWKLLSDHSDPLLLPMIDARRMEVYTAAYTSEGLLADGAEIRALVLTDDEDRAYLREISADRAAFFFGPGAEKAVPVMAELLGAKATFCPGITADASSMLHRGLEKMQKGERADVGYWTPFYLKEFQATTPKKKF